MRRVVAQIEREYGPRCRGIGVRWYEGPWFKGKSVENS